MSRHGVSVPESTCVVRTSLAGRLRCNYPDAGGEGPPFSVSESELREHFAGLSVELVGESKAEAASLQLLDARQKCFHVRF